MSTRTLLLGLAWILTLLSTRGALSQELEPRSFNNVPIGLTFLAVSASRSEGDLSPTPSSPLQDAELTIDAGIAAISHSFSMFGDSAKVDFGAARTCYEGSATFRGEYTEGRRCEYADPVAKLTWNFSGAPALAPRDFATWVPGLVVGASIAIGAPVGDYDSDQLINAGANRWKVKPTIGMSKRVGKWQWELKTGVTLFEDNDDFFGGIRVEQDPLYSASAHLIYNFPRGWLSIDANYFVGGETTKDGVKSDDRQDNSRWGATWSRPLGKRHIIKLFANTGVVTRVGNDFDTYGLAWVYRI